MLISSATRSLTARVRTDVCMFEKVSNHVRIMHMSWKSGIVDVNFIPLTLKDKEKKTCSDFLTAAEGIGVPHDDQCFRSFVGQQSRDWLILPMHQKPAQSYIPYYLHYQHQFIMHELTAQW